MAKIARELSAFKTFTNSISGHTVKKVSDIMLEEMDKFEKGFPDGVYVEPSNKREPRIKVKALFKYCNERGLEPKDLSDKEREQFLVYE
ncbi:hypothetical protein ABWK22_02410 [Gottfriedia acidiceleris]|uniref:hypothetical protein n=1 Tax=Gottfriedia acidiceleris TaxID=371036 RepID=UPI00339B9618